MTLALPLALSFLHPVILGAGAALAAIPIIIHLLSRRQVRRIRWAAMQWLLAAMKRNQRRLRLENWLVLALRVAAILLLAFALARPVLTDSAMAGLLARSKRSVYLILDNSASTGAKATARSVAELVKAEADRVLSDLGTEDTVAVVATNDPRIDLRDGTEPYLLLPRTVGPDGAVRAKEATVALRPRDAPARWAEALRLLQQQMAPEDVNRVVVAITDFQASDWEPRENLRGDPLAERLTALLGTGAAIRVVNVGGEVRRNVAVTAVGHSGARDAFAGRPLAVDVTVTNFGPGEVRGAQLAVFVDADPTPIKRVQVPPLAGLDPGTGKAAKELLRVDLPPSTFAAPGSHSVRVGVTPASVDAEADALGSDSQRWHALRVRDRIRVLAWARTSPRAVTDAETYLRGVYGGLLEMEDAKRGAAPRLPPVYALETATTEGDLVARLKGLTDARPDLVVLAGVAPRGEAAKALVEYVREGGALLAFAGEGIADPAAWNEAFHTDPEGRILPFPVERAETWDPVAAPQAAFRLDFDHATGHPLARPFLDPEAAVFLRDIPFNVRGRMPFRDAPIPGPTGDGGEPAGPREEEGRVVLRFTDGKAAVVAGRLGEGRTVWVATTVDDGWLDFPAPSFFVPVFLDEAAVWLTRPEDRGLDREVGESLTATLPRDASEERFTGPGGAVSVPARRGGQRESDRPVIALDGIGAAGLWKLSYRREGPATSPALEEDFAVNLVPSEGALAAARADKVRDRLPPESDIAFLTSWSQARAESAEVRQGEISRLALWLLLGVLALESLLAWLFGRRRSIASEPGA